MGEEWKSIGLRGMYGYMADLSTEPRWYRTHETFTEDADLNAKIMRTSSSETLQGPVDKDGELPERQRRSVALTMKHFPGGGPQELGLDPHYSFGKTQVYPGDAFGYHLKPFEAAIEAGVSAIMPYYGVPMDVTYKGVHYEEIGMAFSDQIVNGLLRDQLGFRGYVNSDTGIINDRAWGLEEATVPQRVAAAINGGTDTLSGFHDVQTIIDLVEPAWSRRTRVDPGRRAPARADVPRWACSRTHTSTRQPPRRPSAATEHHDGRPGTAAQVRGAAAEQDDGRRRHRPPAQGGLETYTSWSVNAADGARRTATTSSTATPEPRAAAGRALPAATTPSSR